MTETISGIKVRGIKMAVDSDAGSKNRCCHEWRIIENFHEELPRDLSQPRLYAAYCVYCLKSKGVKIKIN